jgi:hypothetical protein
MKVGTIPRFQGFTSMPIQASTVQDNNALPACAHLLPRSGLVQRFLSMVDLAKKIGAGQSNLSWGDLFQSSITGYWA